MAFNLENFSFVFSCVYSFLFTFLSCSTGILKSCATKSSNLVTAARLLTLFFGLVETSLGDPLNHSPIVDTRERAASSGVTEETERLSGRR